MIGKELKQRVSCIKNEILGRSEPSAKKIDIARIIEYIVRFALGLMLAQAQLFGQLHPFAVAFVAASGVGFAGVITFTGALAGYLIGLDFIIMLKYLATAVLTFSALFVFRETGVYKKSWFAPLIAGAMTACVGFVYAADAGWSFMSSTLYAAEVLLTAGAVYFYAIALSPWGGTSSQSDELKHTVSLLILISTALLSLSPVMIFDIISVGRTIAVLLVMVAAFKGGMGYGCACGIAIGIAMDSAGASLPFFTMAYGFSALISGIFSKRGQFLFCLSFILADIVAVLWTWNQIGGISLLYEVFIASVLFILIPSSFMARVASLFPSYVSGYGVLKARDYTRERVEKTAGAFRELYETVKTATGEDRNDSEIATVFDRAAEVTCRKCKCSSKCWQHEYEQTLTVLNDLTPAMMERGSLRTDDFPAYFADECQNLDGFVAAINNEVRALLYRRQYKNKLQENRGAAYNQYADMCSILDELASELGGEIGFEPQFERKLQKYLKSLNIDAATAVFRDRGGRLHIEITGNSLYLLKKDKHYLDKLSSLLETRLCTSATRNTEGRLVLLEAEPLAASVGIAAVKKAGKSTSGDKGTYFKTDEGILYILLSDGMGTGKAAAACSTDIVNILERFLRAGVAPEIALRLLNDLMLLRNETETTCATIDLMSLNLFTGETKMFKFGAAPSYIKRGNKVQKVKCHSFAPGLGASADDGPDLVKMKLDPSSVAVIVSDGVTGGEDDKWIKNIMANYSGSDAKELSKKILETATQMFGCEDDMTILTIFTEKRA